ncbi:MAG: glycosyltransferase family 1 protein [Sulfobacillus thermotolerans]|nr:glycosyltransferase family 1 protein [Sulfobacillus thermotolerans]
MGVSPHHEGPSVMILIDATPLQSEHRVRGVGTYVYYLTRELTRLAGPSCAFFVATQDQKLLPQWVAPVHAVYRPHRPAQVYWLYNEWAIRQVVKKSHPQIFHATDFNGLVPLHDVPVVATLHDLTGLQSHTKHGNLSQRLSAWRWRTYYYEKLPAATHVIAISEQVKQDAIVKLGLDAQKISVIPHGVDTDTLSPRHKGHGLYGNHPPYLLYLGSAEPHKNLPRLLEAFRLVASDYPDLSLYLGGRWQQRDQAGLDKVIDDLKLRDRVKILGYVHPEDKPSLLANATAFVFVSTAEGFGLPILEAMASGVPVVASDIPVFREIATDAALFVNPSDVAHLAKGLQQILADQSLRDDFARRGLRDIESLTWHSVAVKTWAVYHKQ